MADDPEERPASRLRAVIVLAAIAGMIVVVLFVMRQLQQAASIQDCVASGRTNCAPIAAPKP